MTTYANGYVHCSRHCDSVRRGAPLFVLITLLLFGAPLTIVFGQDVPPGVTYKRASAEINSEYQLALEELLSDPGRVPARFAKGVIVVGPMLWKEIDPATEGALRNAGMHMVMIMGSHPAIAEGRRLLTDAHRAIFWAGLWKIHPELANAWIRKAKAPELRYYWATFPTDIEEPFFTLDAGKRQFIIHVLGPKDKDPILCMDMVGDLKSLAK